MSPLPPLLSAKDYQVTDTLAGVRSWKARILLGNSMPKEMKVGDWDDVGYVMVATTDDARFIPLAHCDEHETGYELLYNRSRKWKIDPPDFFPVCASMGATGVFIYEQDEIVTAKVALERWHKAGGPEVTVRWAGRGPRWLIGSRDFLSGGVPNPDPHGDLLPFGRRLLNGIRGVSDALHARRDPSRPWEMIGQGSNVPVRRAIHVLTEILEFDRMTSVAAFYNSDTKKYGSANNLHEALEQWRTTVDEFLSDGDLNGLAELVFGHGGVKNRLHMQIREERKAEFNGDMKTIMGNLELADNEFGRIRVMQNFEPDSELEPTSPGPR